jgi:predicted kinase
MNTSLTPDTEKTLINLGHAFDGYAYAKQVWHTPEQEVHAALKKRLAQVQESGKLFLICKR